MRMLLFFSLVFSASSCMATEANLIVENIIDSQNKVYISVVGEMPGCPAAAQDGTQAYISVKNPNFNSMVVKAAQSQATRKKATFKYSVKGACTDEYNFAEIEEIK